MSAPSVLDTFEWILLNNYFICFCIVLWQLTPFLHNLWEMIKPSLSIIIYKLVWMSFEVSKSCFIIPFDSLPWHWFHSKTENRGEFHRFLKISSHWSICWVNWAQQDSAKKLEPWKFCEIWTRICDLGTDLEQALWQNLEAGINLRKCICLVTSGSLCIKVSKDFGWFLMISLQVLNITFHFGCFCV